MTLIGRKQTKPLRPRTPHPPPATAEPAAPWVFYLRCLLNQPIPTQALAFFFDGFTVLVGSGHSIPKAFEHSARLSDPELHRIAVALEGPVGGGVPLYRALRRYEHRLPEIVLPVLEVGEVSGTMEGASRRLADAFGQSADLQRKFKYGVYDPWLIVAALSLLKGAMRLHDSISGLLSTILLTFITLAGLLIAGRHLLRLVYRLQFVRLWVDVVKLAVPQYGSVCRNLAAARWARSFATMWSAGVPVSTALEVSSRSALNAHYERALLQSARETRTGEALSDSLASSQLLPAYLTDMVRTGESSGSMGICLERLASILENEAYTRATQQFMIGVNTLEVILIVGAVVSVMR